MDSNGQRVAIKVLSQVKDNVALELFTMEKTALEQLNSIDGVIKMLDHGECIFMGRKVKYIVFEYFDGHSLHDVIQ